MTENERSFGAPEGQSPTVKELSQPIRSIAGREFRNFRLGQEKTGRVDLSLAGESDSVIPIGDPYGAPSHGITDVYPERFEGAAGAKSRKLFLQKQQHTMVEYFPEREVQDYVAGEVDELIYKEPLEPNTNMREVQNLNPHKYQGSAGLTSKEVHHRVLRGPIDERLATGDDAGAKKYVSSNVDQVIYGRSMEDTSLVTAEQSELPLKGAANYEGAAGKTSAANVSSLLEPLDLKLQGKHKQTEAQHPKLFDEVDALMGRSEGAAAEVKQVSSIKELMPDKYAGAYGMSSQKIITNNPDNEQYQIYAKGRRNAGNNINVALGGEVRCRLEHAAPPRSRARVLSSSHGSCLRQVAATLNQDKTVLDGAGMPVREIVSSANTTSFTGAAGANATGGAQCLRPETAMLRESLGRISSARPRVEHCWALAGRAAGGVLWALTCAGRHPGRV